MSTLWSSRVEKLDQQWRSEGCKHYRKTIRDKIVELMKPNEEMLDVGCGNAVLYEHLPPELRHAYTGVDFTPEFIQLCRTRFPEGNWKVEEATKLSFPDNHFFLVTSTTVLQHIQDWKKAASELVRVSKKYVVSNCRSHWGKTDIVSTRPVLRRRFNPQDIIGFYSEHGKVTLHWMRDSQGQRTLAMYVLQLE